MKTDCLLIGYNETPFPDYVDMVKTMGKDSGAYRDLNLAFIDYDGVPQTSMDILNLFHFEGQSSHRPFHNMDYFWPALTYLGTYISRRGFTFDYINLFQLEKEKLKQKLLSGDVRTIAITTTLYVAVHPILEIIEFIRRYSDDVKIILGGPYVYNQTKVAEPEQVQELFRYINADFYVISQEGEYALSRLLSALKSGSDLDQVENIAYKSDDHYVLTAASVERNSLEENMVDYSLFPVEEIGQFVSTRTAKSCPFACSFCSFPQRAGKYTYQGVDMVEKELNALYEIGVTTVSFLDDTFNVPKPRFKEILRMMIANKYGFKWNSYFRSDHGDAEAIELMAESGCEGVFLGVESGSDAMLKRMNKTSRRANYMTAIPQLRNAGISIHANFIVGFPGDTYESFQETVSLIEEARPDFYRAQLWYCDPVTPICNKRDEYGIKGAAFNWSHNTMDYKTACDLVDELFLCIRNSTWLPQNGFEQWSTFYLQRHGMDLERIKKFLGYFNDAVKDKLINGDDKPLEPELVENLRASAQFADTGENQPALLRHAGSGSLAV